MNRVIIAGGGLAGCLTALALARRRPDMELLVIEQGDRFGGNHTWSFFDTDIEPDARWVLDGIKTHRWPDHDIRFPRRKRRLGIGYSSIRSADLHQMMVASLEPDNYRLGTAISAVEPTQVRLTDGTSLAGDAIIDARGTGQNDALDLGWQKFVGRIYRFARPHGVARPVIMDGTVVQEDGYRFLYYLPFSDTDLLIEDTYYSERPVIDRPRLQAALDQAAGQLDAGKAEVIDEEEGVLPVIMGGDFDRLWPADDGLPRIGVRAGFFHPTTSYSLPDAVANAALIAAQAELHSAPLAGFLRARAKALWRQRAFFRGLNRMLFRAARPEERYKVLEHFYRLPPALIGRFYAGRLGLLDQARVLTGRPPVALGRAISAMLGKK
ncbi:lycopene beta-cyclase CrtY [Sphingomonas xanthus]|nr:lycopene beta-cyclase CrtY [Sphingomonas xanthus]